MAPTHRSRWDALLVALAAGKVATGRQLRYMVTADEMQGLQGWIIGHLGGFSINVQRPSITSLRHSVEILAKRDALVVFPEGDIYPKGQVKPLRPGLARIALQAAKQLNPSTLNASSNGSSTGFQCDSAPPQSAPAVAVKIVPIHLHYDYQTESRQRTVSIHIGPAINVENYASQGCAKVSGEHLTQDLHFALEQLSAKAELIHNPLHEEISSEIESELSPLGLYPPEYAPEYL